jgi:hypothetical protein
MYERTERRTKREKKKTKTLGMLEKKGRAKEMKSDGLNQHVRSYSGSGQMLNRSGHPIRCSEGAAG